ncbi:stromal cell-derived factor 1-like isoform X1 [Huso huso]|uniref:Stromal cell-derived factor 1 n=2 Tax=Acipenseridae TaxID=7900 RepID=A0ABR0ZS09_HUSHU|nr:chemokine (C-X-C motif) ligand 12a (stromal cell-derived factor 1) isoform X1 [Acipenser ruthenus]
MDVKALAIITLLMVTMCIHVSHAKPFSLGQRCWCRTPEKSVHKNNVKNLKFLNTPNCPLQIIATMRNDKQVCLDPETKWLQQYLKNAINKIKTSRGI